jgi:RHS repeat-associated protein
MRKHFKLGAAVTLSLVLLTNPLLSLASGERKALSKPIKAATSNYPISTRKDGKTFRLPISSSARAGKQGISPEGQTNTLLPDGTQLLIGGQGADGPGSTAGIKDPHTSELTQLPNGLQRARAWHTATLLPDGTILILGGVGEDGQLVEEPELFDPEMQRFEVLTTTGLTARAYHTATLLTEGQVLFVGGMSTDGKLQKKAELYDPQRRTTRILRAAPKTARYGHSASLLADGNVQLRGGTDKNGKAIDRSETYDAASQRFSKSDTEINPQSEFRNPQLEASLPEDHATNVAIDTRIALRFSKPLLVETVNAHTVTLISPLGSVDTKVIPAEGGMLAFITPKSLLLPGTTYLLSLSGLNVGSNLTLADTTISFTTTSPRPPVNYRPVDSEEWIPDEHNLRGDWRSNRADSPWSSLPPLQAAPGITALAGQALTLNGQPLAGVTIKIDVQTTQTDNTGRFLLAEIPAGHHELVIDGRTASKPRRTYGLFEAGVNMEVGKTNVLSYTIWMPKIDTAHTVTIPSPTTAEVVITTPRIPGLELRIPPRTVIRDHEGIVATQISITPIPLDRPPFPLPRGVDVPIYFTVQPGGAYIHTYGSTGPKGARLIYPNYKNRPASTRFDFWHYDPDQRGWYIYGQGSVADDGKQVIPDEGVSIYEFTGAMVAPPSLAPEVGPVDCSIDGDPVNLGTGLFVLSNTDLILPDVLPIALTRTYRQLDTRSRAFGIGASHLYDMFLVGDVFPYTYTEVILPDGGRIHYDRITPGGDSLSAVYENTSSPSGFYKSRISWNGTAGGWNLVLKDGTVLSFGDGFLTSFPGQGGLTGIRDRNGNTVTITRDGSYNVTRVRTSNQRFIDLTYDASNRVTQARDNIGRTVGYTYDASGRLWKVTDAANGVTEYTYDSSHRMTSIKNPRGIVYVTNEYDANGRVSRQTHIDGGVYQFAYTLDGNGKITQTDVTDPRGNVRRVTFSSTGYTLTDTRTCCSGSITTERESGTNIITSFTDQIGRRTEFVNDSMGNVTSVTRLAGTAEAVTTTYSYEPNFNQLTSVTDPLDHSVSFAYDSAGNITGMIDQLGNTHSFSYDLAGQLTSLTDALGATMQFVYDGGDLVSANDPLGNAGTAFIDSAGRVLTVTDPLGQITRNEYDTLNRLTRITDPLQGATQYAYDPDGNLVSVTDARGGVTSGTYDNMDRLATRTNPLLRVESYQYDLNGNVTQVTDRKNQVTRYTYDALNRPVQVLYGDLSSTTYTYDAVSRPTQVVDSISGTINFSYDTLDRVTTEATPQGTISYTYDSADRRTSMTVSGQATINYTYDNANRLTQITQETATVIIGYDTAGRRTSLTLPNGVAAQYSYDARSRLTSISYTKGAVTLGNLTYDYDAVGRRTKIGGSFARTGLPQAVSVASYNAANQQTAFGTQSLSYDLNGNLTGDGINNYGWNARNQLVSIAGPGLSASFQYDGFGRRISKTLNGMTTSFLYDGENAVQDQVGGVPTANMLVGGLDEVFTRSDSAGTWNVLVDALGSTLALTDSSGAIQTQYTYEPFGRTTVFGTGSANSSEFTGRESDATGLYYYRARYYHSGLGRFISEDPAGFDADVNFYAYVRNDPLNWTDPSGLRRVQVCCRGLDYLKPLLSFFRHCYIRITGDKGDVDTYGVVGNRGSRKNQIPRHGNGKTEDDGGPDRNSGGEKTCKDAKGDDCQVDKLKKGLEKARQSSSCPSCGANYREWIRTDLLNFFDGFNSNTWVYNMISGAGMTPPPQSRAPGYHQAPGPWYP